MGKSKLLSRLPSLEDVRRELYRRSCLDFVQGVVKIEDRDSPDLAVPFALWPKQIKVLETFLSKRLIIVLKARQLGLTWLALAYAVWRMLFQPGYSVIALSKREDDAKELVRRVGFILKHLPHWLAQEARGAKRTGWQGPTYETTTTSVTIYHPSAEPSTFQSLTSSPASGRTYTASLLILDEWAHQPWQDEIWSAVYPTINRPTGGQVIGISTAKRGTLYEQCWESARKGENGFTPVFLPWWSDPRRTQEWYDQTKRDMPTMYKQEYPATPEEAFSASEGVAFPEFSREIHVVEPFQIPWWWRRWRANDPGYTDPFAWYCFAADEDGNVYIYREYTRLPHDPRVTYSDQAREFVRMCTMIDDEGEEVPETFSFTVTGRDAWNRHPETGKAIVDYYAEGGIKDCIEPPRDKRTDRVLRKAVFHEYLKPYVDENTGKTTAKLKIFSTCRQLIETLPKLLVDPNDPEKVAESSLDHWYDAAGYGLVAWHAKRSQAPKPKKSIIAEHKDKVARRRRYMRRVLA